MPQITVSVAEKNYVLSCAAGDEERLSDLAQVIDDKATDLKSKLGHVSESRLLLMAALVLADELSEAKEQLHAAENDTSVIEKYAADPAGYSDEELAVIIDQVAMEVEGIAQSLTNE